MAKGKNKDVFGLIKDELCREILKYFVGLRARRHSCLKVNNDEDKKKKKTRKSVMKIKIKFQDYKNCLEAS